MFFFLSKFLFFFTQPFNWILLLALWALLTRNAARKKKLWIATGCLFLFFSNPYLINEILIRWQAKEKIMSKQESYEVGILLTGFCFNNEKTGRGYFSSASDRFIQTVKLYHQGHIKRIIVTGGSSKVLKNQESLKEADFVCEQLTQMGIPADRILKENQSRNTHENGVFTKNLIDSLRIPPPYLLITSATHIPRALHVFNKVGLPTTPYASNYLTVENRFSFPESLIPSSEAFEKWNKFTKENIGLFLYKLTGKA